MAREREVPLRDWHRLFGLLLTDFFAGSPFIVEVERDLSQQQQFLDVVIVRRRRGRFAGTLPDGLAPLAEHNLITFKSHHEALLPAAVRELVGSFVAYRKLVSPSPSDQLPEEQFRLYAVAARFPHNLSSRVPWRQVQAGVYDCDWGIDTVRILVAGELPQEERNAPLHLFSASPGLVDFAGRAYRRRSPDTSGLLGQLFEGLRREGFTMSFTMEDFRRQFIREHLPELTTEERREIVRSLPPEDRRAFLQSLPPEERLAGLSAEQIQQYLDRLTPGGPTQPPRPRRKK
jgi:hypothetical protein